MNADKNSTGGYTRQMSGIIPAVHLSGNPVLDRKTISLPEQPGPKPWNREGAKDAKEIFNFWYLTEESLAFLRDLRAFAVNILFALSAFICVQKEFLILIPAAEHCKRIMLRH
jgi:hypothetical protein